MIPKNVASEFIGDIIGDGHSRPITLLEVAYKILAKVVALQVCIVARKIV